jgi:hypothetical protein
MWYILQPALALLRLCQCPNPDFVSDVTIMMFVFRHLPENQELTWLRSPRFGYSLRRSKSQIKSRLFDRYGPCSVVCSPGRIGETDDFDLVVKGPIIPERTPCLRCLELTLSVASGVVDNERKYIHSPGP